MANRREDTKDVWDKVEIAGKVALPLVLLLGGYYLNQQLNERQRATELVSIAISVLAADRPENLSPVDEAIRDWAIDVLRDPQGWQSLPDDVAQTLKADPIYFRPSTLTSNFVVSDRQSLDPRTAAILDPPDNQYRQFGRLRPLIFNDLSLAQQKTIVERLADGISLTLNADGSAELSFEDGSRSMPILVSSIGALFALDLDRLWITPLPGWDGDGDFFNP